MNDLTLPLYKCNYIIMGGWDRYD